MNGDIILLCGGTSSERLVSVASAQNLATVVPGARVWFLGPRGEVFVLEPGALLAHERPFEVELVPPGPPRWPRLGAALDDEAARGATFLLALHGGEGEDGTVQALLERKPLAFTGSGSRASALAFDKAAAKAAARAHGARVAEAHELPVMAVEEARVALARLGPARWVLKPRADGSSHGLFHLTSPADVEAAARLLAATAVPYLAEAFVAGRELTVGVVDDEGGPVALPASEVVLVPGGAFDYAGKYLGRGTTELTPATLTAAEREAAQALAVLTHRAVGCEGYSRTDMILTSEGPVLLEINTLPGLTRASFIPQQLAAAGRSLPDFVRRQLELARRRAARGG